MARSLGEHDPYRNMQTGEEAIYSDYEKNAGKKIDSDNAVDGASGSKTDLFNAEKAATREVENWSNSQQEDVRAAEENADGLYSGSGKSEEKAKATGWKGIAKKGGPFFAILFVIFGAGGIMTGTQMFQPFSLVAQFEEAYNSMRTSANIRSEKFFRIQMKKNRKVKSPYNIFGTKFSISEKQQQKLREQGIEYDSNYKGEKVLWYTNSKGERVPVTAKNFKSIYSTDADFFHKYNAGSMTWRGSIANWFGTNTRNFLKNNNLTRNMFEKYKEEMEKLDSSGKTGGDQESGGGGGSSGDDDSKKSNMSELEKQKEVAKKTIESRIKEDGELRLRVVDDGEELDADGNGTGKSNKSEARLSGNVKSKTEVKQLMDNIAGKYGSGANLLCAAFNAFGAINLVVSAHQALQILNLTTSFFEVVDKTKAGLGDEAPLMAYSNALNERIASSNIIIENNGEDLEDTEAVEIVRDRTAMESAGIASIYGGGPADPSDPSVSSFNLTNNMKNVLGGLGLGIASFEACTVARLATAVVSLGLSASCILTAGIGCLVKAFTKIKGKDVLKSAGVGVLLSFLTPAVANIMQRNILKDFAGENYGNALAMGALMYLGSTHRANGGSLSSIKKYKQFAVQQSQVIAENAKYEREGLNPFDITSKYTFMGTLLTQMMSFTHANSIMSTLTASGSVINTSLIGMTDTALAYGIADDLPDNLDEYADTCPYLASIGAIGDSFCNPYVISDISTMDKDPDEVLNKLKKNFSSDDGENVTIDGSSDLAKYIKYCDNRQSAFGIVDQNIAGEVAGTGDIDVGDSTANGFINGAVGAMPFIGDAIDIIQSVEQSNNIGYISGESCVAGNSVSAPSSPDWSKAKYYQRFIEDQSLAESMGIIEKSAVTAYLEDYYKEHPLDNSYEGIIARYSGLTKDNVVALLDFINYAQFVANYDASDRYAFGSSGVEPSNEIYFEQENILSGDSILLGYIVYADVRNRSFAV